MNLIVTKKIGKRRYSFTFTGQNFHEVVMESEKLSFPDVDSCGLCGSDDLRLHAYKTSDDGYEYTVVLCGKCRGKVTFGQRRDDKGTYFLRKNDDGAVKWEKYENPRQAPYDKPPNDRPEPPQDDLPF